ncbi:MAG: D-alanyl-D-alanine carboxypeptidase family protein [Acidimicrobiales bacterium]
MPHSRPRNSLRFIAALLVLFTLSLSALPSEADLSSDLEKLKEEREQLKEARQEQAKAIDATTAEANELAAALAALNEQVNAQEEALASAEAELRAAEQRYAVATQAVVDKVAEIDSLQIQVSDRAISAFVDQNVGSTPVLENTDPNRAVRMQSLVRSVTRQEVDITEQLKVAREDLALEQGRADQAADEAEQYRIQIQEELEALQVARDRQSELADEAEARLESQLAEAAVMAERDKAIAADITAKNAELQRQAELARRRAAAARGATNNTRFPTANEIVKVGTFWVHQDIASNVRQLLDHAARDGITLGGWGYRDHSAQIRLRKAHCGGSNYAVYSMPSSQCRPPTARPGASQHELGKAIDFTNNGRTIGSRSNPAYQWLKQNAASYGLYNLPSEPWHWSVNGR